MNPINASTLQSGNLKIDPSVASVLVASDESGNDDKDQKSSFSMLAVAGVALVALLFLSRSKK
jgi:hypothetical protein